MLNRLRKLLEDDEEPPNPIEETIHELQNGIDTIEQRLTQITETSHVYLAKLSDYKSQKTAFMQQAQALYKKNDETRALIPFKKAKILEDQIIEYEALVQSVDASKNKLFRQKNEFELRKDQLSAQLRLGEIDADASQTQAEIMENLMLLENSGEMSKYDFMILEAESKSEAIQEILGTENSTAKNDQSAELSFEELDHEIKKVNKEATATTLANARKKYASFFEEAAMEDQSLANQKADLLKQLRESVSRSDDKLKTFFQHPSRISEADKKQDRIKNFFGE